MAEAIPIQSDGTKLPAISYKSIENGKLDHSEAGEIVGQILQGEPNKVDRVITDATDGGKTYHIKFAPGFNRSTSPLTFQIHEATNAILIGHIDPELNPWSLLLHLGDNNHSALQLAGQFGDLFGSLLSFQLNEPAQRFFDSLGDNLFEADFRDLYHDFPLPEGFSGTPAERRRVKRTQYFSGTNEGDKYLLKLSPGKNQNGNFSFGDLRASTSMGPTTIPGVEDKPAYKMETEGRVGAGSLKHQDIAEMFEALLIGLERVAKAKIPPENLKDAQTAQPALVSKITSLKILAVIRWAMPNLARFLDRFIKIENIGTLRKHPDGDYLEIDLKFSLKLSAFEKDYPKLHDFLDDLRGVFQIGGGFKTISGNNVFRFHINSEDHSTRVRFLVRNGAIIPSTDDGKPVKGEEIHPTQVRKLNLNLSLRGNISVAGTNIDLQQLPIRVVYDTRPGRAGNTFRINQNATVKVSGAGAFAADFLIPGTIGEHIEDALHALAYGADGKGTEVSGFIVNEADGQNSHLEGEFNTAALDVDNAFIKLFLKIVRFFVELFDNSKEDIRHFWKDFYKNMSADYRANRTHLQETPRPLK